MSGENDFIQRMSSHGNSKISNERVSSKHKLRQDMKLMNSIRKRKSKWN